MDSKNQPSYVSWQNQKLSRDEDRLEEKCENVRRCNYTTEKTVKYRQVPQQNCNPYETTEEVCNDVPVTKVRYVSV